MKLKPLVLATSLTLFAAFSAQAAVLTTTADLNPASDAEQYRFFSNLSGTGTFSDVVNLSITDARDLVASASGSEQNYISFTTFDLYSSATDTLVEHGFVGNFGAKLSYGALESEQLLGNYYIKIEGIYSGLGVNSGSYNGNITLTTAVPEPESYAMMLAGIGLMGFVASRRAKSNA